MIYGDKKNYHSLKKEDINSELHSGRNDYDKIKKMTNREAAQGTRNITICTFLLLPANAAVYADNVAFSTIATKIHTDSAAAVVAGDNAAADNSGYSLDKIDSPKCCKSNGCTIVC